MKALVPIKRVVDYNVKVRPLPDGSDVDLSGVKMSINPFCEIAVEEAVRLKEQGVVDEIVVVTVGEEKAQEQLRSAMALGADRGILVKCEVMPQPLEVAKALQSLVEQETPDIIIMGKQSIDGDNNQTGQMLAARIGRPMATFASKLVIEDQHAIVTREVDGGLQTIKVQLPAVVTTDLRLNEPRYAALPNIMKAKKKPLDIQEFSALGVASESRQTVVSVQPPAQRQAGIIVDTVDELVDKLKNEAKVI